MRRNSTMLAFALASLAVLPGCAAPPPYEANSAVTVAGVDTMAARLTELELQRISLLALPRPEAPSLRDVDSAIASLHDRLRLLHNRASAERVVGERLMLALDARESSVASRLQQLRFTYTETHPMVVLAATEARLIEQRKAELGKPGH